MGKLETWERLQEYLPGGPGEEPCLAERTGDCQDCRECKEWREYDD